MTAAHVTWFEKARQIPRRNGPIVALQSALPSGRLIGPLTATRTAGVDTTTRAGTTPARSAAVDVRVADAAWTALEALTVLTRHAADVACSFRAEDEVDARRGLLQLLQGTDVLVSLARMTWHLAGGAERSLPGRHGDGLEDQTVQVIYELIAGEFEDDFVGVAATLEGRFTHALHGWRAFFESLAGRSSSPEPNPSAA